MYIIRRVEFKRDDRLWDRAMAVFDYAATEAKIPPHERLCLRIAFDEAISNVHDHSQTETVIVKFFARDTEDGRRRATVELLYKSDPFDTGTISPIPDDEDPPVSLIPVRGYGIGLMKELAEARWTFNDSGSVVRAVAVTLSKSYLPAGGRCLSPTPTQRG